MTCWPAGPGCPVDDHPGGRGGAPLLAERGCTVEGGVRLRTLADVITHLGARGRVGLLDATEVRVRRPAAHRAGRQRFISGKARAITAQGAGPHRP